MQTKDISGYEGRYQITTTGKVLSLPNGSRKGIRELKQEKNTRKTITYRRVSLSVGGRVVRQQVHRLVATAFIPNPDNKPFVNHLDNNGENNTVENLEWCTHSENMVHAQKQGRLFKAQSTGGKTAHKNALPALLMSLQTLLGNRLIKYEIVRKNNVSRGYVTFQCKNCKNTYKRRVDSPVIKRNGICKDCL